MSALPLIACPRSTVHAARDIEEWGQGLRRASPLEAFRQVAVRALRNTGFYGSLAFLVGYLVNFGNVLGLWATSAALAALPARMWLLGSLVFLKVLAGDARSRFDSREASLQLLRSQVGAKPQPPRFRRGLYARPPSSILAELDRDADGVVTMGELQAFFESKNILLSEELLRDVLSEATWRSSSSEVDVATLTSSRRRAFQPAPWPANAPGHRPRPARHPTPPAPRPTRRWQASWSGGHPARRRTGSASWWAGCRGPLPSRA